MTASTSKLLPNFLIGKAGQYTIFSVTQVLPTYLFVLAAGQYVSITATVDQLHNDIPMKVYALASYQAQLTKYANFVF